MVGTPGSLQRSVLMDAEIICWNRVRGVFDRLFLNKLVFDFERVVGTDDLSDILYLELDDV